MNISIMIVRYGRNINPPTISTGFIKYNYFMFHNKKFWVIIYFIIASIGFYYNQNWYAIFFWVVGLIGLVWVIKKDYFS